jgi:putative aldouronate transport system permease protein
MSFRKTWEQGIFDAVNGIIMMLLIFACLYPMIHILFASVSEPTQLIKHQGLLLFPLGFTIKGYKMVLDNPDIIRSFLNTTFYVCSGTLLNLLMTSLAAFVLSRKDVLLTKPLMMVITFTMFFGGGLIPSYLLVKNLGMMNSFLALIVPGAISTWNLIIMRTSFMSVPEALIEAAKLEGANDLKILWHVILPLSKSIIAVMALFYAVGHWNSWFEASIYIRDRAKFPLQLLLREVLIMADAKSMAQSQDLAGADMYKQLVKYVMIVLASFPILVVYPFLQKYFVKGVLIGSLKE